MSLSLKQEYAIIHYIKSGCDVNKTLESFPGTLTKNTLNKYLRMDEAKEYISNMNKEIEHTLKINKTLVVAETLDIQQITKADKDYKTSLTALKQVSQMMGYDAPTTTNVNVDLSSWLVEQDVIEAQIVEEVND